MVHALAAALALVLLAANPPPPPTDDTPAADAPSTPAPNSAIVGAIIFNLRRIKATKARVSPSGMRTMSTASIRN